MSTGLIEALAKAATDDPDGTAMLIDLAMYEMAREAAPEVDSRLVRDQIAAMDESVALAKASLVRTYVAKASSGTYPETDYLTKATWLDAFDRYLEVAKASWEQWNTDRGSVRREVARDAFGRFTRIQSKPRPVVGTAAAAMSGRPKPVAERTMEDRGAVVLNPGVPAEEEERLARFQGAYEQSVKDAYEVFRALGRPDTDGARAQLSLADGTTTESFPLAWLAEPTKEYEHNGTKASGVSWLSQKVFTDLDGVPVGMMVLPGKATTEENRKRIEAMRDLNLLGQVDALARQHKRGLMQAATPREWGETRSAAAMGRIGIAGDIIETVAPGSKVGLMARYIGSHGPEAYRAMAPHLRRTAYRYRGTERTPDRDLAAQMHGSPGETVRLAGQAVDSGQIRASDLRTRIPRSGPRNEVDPMLTALRTRSVLHPTASGDSLVLGARSDAAAAHLLESLPRKALIGIISDKARRGIPSQGVIIDRNGQVVSQSVGVASDHYLPFNLNNLRKRLRGGQYVRTRVQGGLTGEDIYTAVAAGARSVTVASGSGVFRLEFSPDFRGARAMSDKAGSMYETYLNILAAIENEELYSRDLDDEKLAELSDKARSAVGQSASHQVYQAKLDELVAEAKRSSTGVTAKERAELRAKAEAEHGKDTPEAREAFDSALYDLRQEKIQEINLNGDGYALALQTLAAQYPYFVRSTEYVPLKANPASDRRTAEGMDDTVLASSGFFARLGLRAPGGIASSGKDRGYQRPGAETWRTGGERQAYLGSQESAGAASTTTTTTGARATTGTQAATGTQANATGAARTPAAPATTSATAGVAASKAKLTVASRKKAIEDFTDVMQTVSERSAGEGGPGSGPGNASVDISAPFSDVDPGNRAKQVYWLVMQQPAIFGETLRSDPQGVFEALTANESDWKKALGWAFAADGLDDMVSSNKPLGATTVDDFVSAMRGAAGVVLDMHLAAEPFVEATDDAVMNTTGQALDFSEFTSAQSGADVAKILEDGQYAEVTDRASRLGTDLTPDGYVAVPLSESGRRMGVIIGGLRALDETRAKIAADRSLATQKVSTILSSIPSLDAAEFRTLTGLTDDQIAGALDLEGSAPQSDTFLLEEARSWQRARSLVETARVHDLLEAGGAAPKASDLVLAQWMNRAGPFSKAQPVRSSRPVVRLAADHPLAAVVALRKAAGRPLVSARVSS